MTFPESDKEEPRMEPDKPGLLCMEETKQLIACGFEVLNVLGHGLLEKPYENAIVVELRLRGIPFSQQPKFDVIYKTVKVGEYFPDLVAFDSVVVDAKVIERITDHEIGQMLNYLKVTGFKVGLILNFKRPRLEWKRGVNSAFATVHPLRESDRIQ